MNDILKDRLKQLTGGDKKKKKGKKEKEPKGISQRGYYDITLSNFQFHLYTLICQVNGIEETEYLSIDRYSTVLLENLKINKHFKKLSKLDWENAYPIDSRTFRGKFISIFMLNVIHNTHPIVKHIYEALDEPDVKRYEAYNKILQEWITRVDLFISTYLTRDLSYEEHLQAVYEFLVLASGRDHDCVQKLVDAKDFLVKSIKTCDDDGILCNNITKTAFVVATDSVNVKHTAPYEENIDYRDDDACTTQVGMLGLAIMRRRKKCKYVPMLYSAFTKANPKMYTKLDDTPEIVLGVQALYALKFYIDDDRVSRYIDKLIRE